MILLPLFKFVKAILKII